MYGLGVPNRSRTCLGVFDFEAVYPLPPKRDGAAAPATSYRVPFLFLRVGLHKKGTIHPRCLARGGASAERPGVGNLVVPSAVSIRCVNTMIFRFKIRGLRLRRFPNGYNRSAATSKTETRKSCLSTPVYTRCGGSMIFQLTKPQTSPLPFPNGYNRSAV